MTTGVDLRPATTPLNGHYTQLRPGVAAEAATEPRRKFDLHGEGFVSGISYGFAFLMATIGGASAAAPRLGWDVYSAGGAWLGVESLGVFTMVFAARRMRKGEKAIVARLLSAAFAGGAASLNYFGHAGNLWQAFLFTGASLGAYAMFLLQTGAKARDQAIDEGRREAKPFRYPLSERLLHPIRARLAAEILSRNPGTDPNAARLAAADHPIMLAFIRARLAIDIKADGQVGRRAASEVDGILHVLEPHTLVPMFRDQMGPYREDLVKVMVAELGAKSLLLGQAPARQKISPPQVDAAALTRSPSRPSRAVGQATSDPTKATNDPTTHTGLALTDAATIRRTYPTGLPDRGAQRKLRDEMGWHPTKATNALNAYRAGADLTSGSTGSVGSQS